LSKKNVKNQGYKGFDVTIDVTDISVMVTIYRDMPESYHIDLDGNWDIGKFGGLWIRPVDDDELLDFKWIKIND
jgi:hypothetical protein